MRLVAIWLLFFAYVALMVYLYIKVEVPEKPTLNTTDSTIVADTSQLSENEADSLLAVVYRAYEKEDYDLARRVAAELEKKYPNSTHTEMASRLIAAISKDSLLAENQPAKHPPSDTSPTKASREKLTKKSAKQPSAGKIPRRQPPAITKPSQPEYTPEDLQQALAKLRQVRDDETGVTWYFNKFLSHYVYKNSLEAYIGKDDHGGVQLRIRIYYTGKKRLNIDSYEVYADDQVFTISTLSGTIKRGEGPMGAWEWFDMQAGEKEIAMLSRVMNADRAAIRYIGDKNTWERSIGELEKLRLSYIMRAYRVLESQQELLTSNVGAR